MGLIQAIGITLLLFGVVQADQSEYEALKDLQTFLSPVTHGRNRIPQSSYKNQLSTAKLRSTIERLIEVRCESERMSIFLHHSRMVPKVMEDIVKRAKLYLEDNGDTVTECKAVDADDAIMLSAKYDECGITMEGNVLDSVAYSARVIVEANVSDQSVLAAEGVKSTMLIRERYKVECLRPASMKTANQLPIFTLALSNDKYAESFFTYPHIMESKKFVFLSSNVTIPWYKGQNLQVYTYPIDCWSWRPWSNLDGHDETTKMKGQKKYFVRNGCPVNDNRDRGLSNIHHFKDGPTKVSVLASDLLWDDGYGKADGSDPFQNITIGCDLVPCTHSATTGLLNIPKCPLSYYCSGTINAGNVLPAQLQAVPRSTMLTGPITVKEIREHKDASVTPKCKPCDQTSPVHRVQYDQTPPDQVIYVEGVQLHMTTLVALISFLMGIVAMGAFWWIHDKTDPRRLGLTEQCQSGPDQAGTGKPTSSMIMASGQRSRRFPVHDSGCHSISSSNQCIKEPNVTLPFLHSPVTKQNEDDRKNTTKVCLLDRHNWDLISEQRQ